MDGFGEADGIRAQWSGLDGQGDGELWIEASEPASSILIVVPVRTGEHAVVVLAGDIDISTTEQVRVAAEQCLRERPQRLSIDVSGLQFCDCSGVRVLRGVLEKADAAGVEFRIVAPNAWIRRVFALADAEDLLSAADIPVFDDFPG